MFTGSMMLKIGLTIVTMKPIIVIESLNQVQL